MQLHSTPGAGRATNKWHVRGDEEFKKEFDQHKLILKLDSYTDWRINKFTE